MFRHKIYYSVQFAKIIILSEKKGKQKREHN